MDPKLKESLRNLPSVAVLLEHEEVQAWLTGLPRGAVVAAVQQALEEARAALLEGACAAVPEPDEIIARAEELVLAESLPSLRRVINATGIVLHTGLGRAPLCEAAIDALVEAGRGYCNLEYELETGKRGKRQAHVAERLAELAGAEAATVVNNNAAATLLILHTFARGRGAIVSRGQLVEIGGSFRLPAIMDASGARMCEVGTTNRTRISDYEQALKEDTALLLRVHTSNYRIVGFTETPTIGALAELAHRYEKLAVDDLGSGALVDFARLGLPAEPAVRESVAAGADLVCFSGDKLLGGPQCGIIVGKRALIRRIEADPLMRTYRVGKLTLAALDATLRHFADEEEALAQVPALTMLAATTEQLAEQARQLCDQFAAALPDEQFLVCSDVGFAGGGSLPGAELETVVVQWRPGRVGPTAMVAALRQAEVPVVARIREDAICFDLRTIPAEDFEELVGSVAAVLLDDEAPEDP